MAESNVGTAGKKDVYFHTDMPARKRRLSMLTSFAYEKNPGSPGVDPGIDDNIFAQKKDKSDELFTPQGLSKFGERIRLRLIREFRLLDNLDDMEAGLEAPKYYTDDIADEQKCLKIIRDTPYALVKLSPIKQRQASRIKQERKWKRLKCRESRLPLLEMWAEWVSESNIFQSFILFLIVVNAVVVAVEADYQDGNKNLIEIQYILRICRGADYICVWFFVVEILLKWWHDFKGFWKSQWNIADFIITSMSIVPEIIGVALGAAPSGTIKFILDTFKVFRIIRLLKLVSKQKQARIILLSVTKAFSAMTLILLLLALFMAMFALMGQILFDKYKDFDVTNTDAQFQNQDAFSDTFWAMATLFQLMTLDHWRDTLEDLLTVMNTPVEQGMTVIFIFAWIWFGSFVFKNIFAGIMVNNFQSISNDIHWAEKEKAAKIEIDKFKEEFQAELTKMAENPEEEEPDDGDSHLDVNQSRTSAGPIHIPPNQKAQAELLERTDIRRKNSNPSKSSLSSLIKQTGRTLTAMQQNPAPNKNRLNVQGLTAALSKHSALTVASHLTSVSSENKDQPLTETDIERAEWDNLIQRHLDMQSVPVGETVWPRDLLFEYYNAMERLQDNIKGQRAILGMLNLAILRMHDE